MVNIDKLQAFNNKFVHNLLYKRISKIICYTTVYVQQIA